MSFGKGDLPQEMSSRIGDIQVDAQRSAQDLASDTLKDVNQAAKVLEPDSFDEDIGYSNEAMISAIRNRSGADYSRSLDNLKGKTSFDAINRKFNRLKNAAELVSAEHAHNERARQLRYAERQRKKALRGQIVGSVLGIGGAVAGGILSGGNPAGIMAGSMIGQGIGNAAAGEGV